MADSPGRDAARASAGIPAVAAWEPRERVCILFFSLLFASLGAAAVRGPVERSQGCFRVLVGARQTTRDTARAAASPKINRHPLGFKLWCSFVSEGEWADIVWFKPYSNASKWS